MYEAKFDHAVDVMMYVPDPARPFDNYNDTAVIRKCRVLCRLHYVAAFSSFS